MEGVTYTGFAHGVAGIVAFLAHHARRFDAPEVADAACRGGEWLLDQAKAGAGAMSLWFPVQAAVRSRGPGGVTAPPGSRSGCWPCTS